MMKLLSYLILTFSLSSMLCHAQEFNANAEIARMVNIPNSPEAAAFTKYGNTSVSMYTGTPNIQVPIYTIRGRELDLPISLSYDASGIKVEQLATQVGLGWSLNVGGRISRVTNGQPDDFLNASPEYSTIWDNTDVRQPLLKYTSNNNLFDSEQDVINYFTFLRGVHDGRYDALPDYFSFNALGISDYFVFDVNTMQPKALNNPRIKVAFTKGMNNSIRTWTVTNEEGTMFYFNERETTDATTDDLQGVYGIIKSYNSSWVLTKIESQNKKDIYELAYTSKSPWSQPQPAALVQSITVNKDDGNNNESFYPSVGGKNVNSTYKISQKFLSSIRHNGKKIVDIDLGSRKDIYTSNMVDKIKIYRIDQENAILKYFDFKYSYFKNKANTEEILANHENIRLKLDAIDINSPNNTLNSYSFEYDSPNSLPSRRSLSQDYLGYYNGADNEVLYPKIRIDIDTYDGANRYSDFDYAKKGILTTIKYPTGGYTNFEYEPHYVKESVRLTSTGQVPNTVKQDVYYLLARLAGGTGDPCAPTDYECLDMYPNGAPKRVESSFSIEESGTYNIEGAITSTTSSGQFPSQIEISGKNASTGTQEVLWYFHEGRKSIYLEKGRYKVKMLNPNEGRTLTAKVWREEEVVLPNSTGFYGGKPIAAGIRVKAIRDYTDTNALALEKEYKYNEDGNGGVLFTPKLEYTTITEEFKTDSPYVEANGFTTTYYSNRVTSSSGGDRPHIVYNKVHEILKGPNNSGYIEYLFNTSTNGSGVFSYGVPPFANHYLINHKHGKQKEANIYNGNDDLISKTKTYYEDIAFDSSVKGIYIDYDGGSSQWYPVIKPSTTNPGKYVYNLVKGSGILWVQGGAVISPCNRENPETGRCLPKSLGPLKKRTSFSGSRVGYTTKIEKTEYFNAKALHTTTDFVHDPAIDFLLRESITTDSNDTILKKKLYYPKDNNVIGANELIASNRLNEVVKTETYRGNDLLLTQKTDYNVSINPNVVMPDVISTQKSTDSGSLNDRIHYEYYDNGNLKETYLTNGVHTVYIWGYDNTLPIAKIENATYTQVSNQIATLQSKSNADNDRTINEGALRTALTSLRNSLPNAMVTTYTYDPLIGVTSMTDPKGYTVFYEYDEFSRLEKVRDADGNLVNEYYYDYYVPSDGEIPLDITINTPSWLETNTSTVLEFITTGGSGNYTYSWEITTADYKVIHGSSDAITLQTGNKKGTTVIVVKVTDNVTRKTKTLTKSIAIYHPLVAITDHPTEIEVNTVADFMVNPSGGSGNYTYSWTIDHNATSQNYTSTQKSFSLTMGYEFYDRVTVNCTVADTVTQQTKTVSREMTVQESEFWMVTLLKHPKSQTATSETFDIEAKAGGGSGSYSYKWYVNGAYKGSSSSHTVTLSCSGLTSAVVKCEVTDVYTGKNPSSSREFTINPTWCDGDGGGGSDTNQ